MIRQGVRVGAASLLIALAGCALQFGNTAVHVGVKVNEQVVNEALDSAAQKIQNQMSRLGLTVAVSRDGETARLTSTTRAGQKFTVLLNRVNGPQGEQTRVHVEWDTAPDEALWLQLIGVLVTTPTAK
jgi:hypothetical protein